MLPYNQDELSDWQSIRQFSCKIRPRCGQWWLMAVSKMSFYGDESGSHGEGPFVLSGYLGLDKDWDSFEESWHDILHDASIGGYEIDYFHMRECFKLEGEFAKFMRRQADKKLYALVDVLVPLIRSGKIREFTAILDWDTYNHAVLGPLKDVYHNPYLPLFGAIMAETVKAQQITEVGEGDLIHFWLDDQIQRVEYDVGKQFYYGKHTLPRKYSRLFDTVMFRNDEWCYPLQAADLIAWQRHRRDLNLTEDLGERREYKRLHNASSGKGKLMRYREDGLLKFSRETDTKLRAAGLLECGHG